MTFEGLIKIQLELLRAKRVKGSKYRAHFFFFFFFLSVTVFLLFFVGLFVVPE